MEHSKKLIRFLVLVVILSFNLYALVLRKSPVPSASAVDAGPNVGVYWDQGCTQGVDSIGWGTLQVGGTQEVDVNVRNEGNDTFIMELVTQDWQPGNAYQWLTFSWSCGSTTIAPGQVVEVTLTLSVASDFPGGFSGFSFSIVFQGGSYLLGDVNKDGVVDLQDLAIIAAAYGSTPASPRWNAQADINNDGIVNLLDLMLVAGDYGKTSARAIIVNAANNSVEISSSGIIEGGMVVGLTVYQDSAGMHARDKSGNLLMSSTTDAGAVIDSAISHASDGDTINVNSGRYTFPSGSRINAQHNGITLTFSNGAVLVAGSGYSNPWEYGLISVRYVSNWVIQGGELDGSGNGRRMCGVTVCECTNVIIQNMYVHNIGKEGYGIFFLMNCNNCKALNNTVSYVGANGITLGFYEGTVGSDSIMSYNLLAQGNNVTHCSDVGIDTQGVTNGIIDGNTVANMDTYNGFNTSPAIVGHWGIGLEPATVGLTIENNNIHDCLKNTSGYGGYGIAIMHQVDLNTITITNNIEYNNNINVKTGE